MDPGAPQVISKPPGKWLTMWLVKIDHSCYFPTPWVPLSENDKIWGNAQCAAVLMWCSRSSAFDLPFVKIFTWFQGWCHKPITWRRVFCVASLATELTTWSTGTGILGGMFFQHSCRLKDLSSHYARGARSHDKKDVGSVWELLDASVRTRSQMIAMFFPRTKRNQVMFGWMRCNSCGGLPFHLCLFCYQWPLGIASSKQCETVLRFLEQVENEKNQNPGNWSRLRPSSPTNPKSFLQKAESYSLGTLRILEGSHWCLAEVHAVKDRLWHWIMSSCNQ